MASGRQLCLSSDAGLRGRFAVVTETVKPPGSFWNNFGNDDVPALITIDCAQGKTPLSVLQLRSVNPSCLIRALSHVQWFVEVGGGTVGACV